jgi:hypothetical protein
MKQEESCCYGAIETRQWTGFYGEGDRQDLNRIVYFSDISGKSGCLTGQGAKKIWAKEND